MGATVKAQHATVWFQSWRKVTHVQSHRAVITRWHWSDIPHHVWFLPTQILHQSNYRTSAVSRNKNLRTRQSKHLERTQTQFLTKMNWNEFFSLSWVDLGRSAFHCASLSSVPTLRWSWLRWRSMTRVWNRLRGVCWGRPPGGRPSCHSQRYDNDF